MKKIKSLAFISIGLLFSDVCFSQNMYGQHYPNGNSAVQYIYGSEGMWKKMDNLSYNWILNEDPYNKCTNKYGIPLLSRQQAVGLFNGSANTTTLDANCHLLLDWNHDGKVDEVNGGYAFYEHNGKGVGGVSKSTPFSVYWFDDNWLARYMSEAYNRSPPNGLTDYNDFVRWRILGGDTKNWMIYANDSNDFDRLALNGLYYLFSKNVSKSLEKWNRMLVLSSYFKDASSQTFKYPNIRENYHLGLFQILTTFLLNNSSVKVSKKSELLQHWVSLRSNILSNQERNGSSIYGWRSDITNTASLMNTETIAVNALALGANSLDTFEAGSLPLKMSKNNYFIRPYNVLSAVTGLSMPGYMTFGPYKQYSTGSRIFEFTVRSSAPIGKVATIDIYDAKNNKLLASKDVLSSELKNNNWSQIILSANISNSDNSLEFRTYWHGSSNLDIATIRVR